MARAKLSSAFCCVTSSIESKKNDLCGAVEVDAQAEMAASAGVD